ncbi:MAG: transporter [Acidobacteriota bacterium]
MKNPGWAAFVLLSLVATTDAPAQVLPFFTNTALTVGFESNAVRTFSRFVFRNKLETEGREVPDSLDRDVFAFVQVFAVPLRINSETVFTVIAPVVHKELNLTPPGLARRQLSGSDLGDVTLLIKRRFYVNNFLGGGFQAAIIGGLKLPTGSDQGRDSLGNLLPRPLQIGTGSLDVPVGLVFTAFKDRIGFNSEILHKFTTQSKGFEFGDETDLNLALGYRLTPKSYQSINDKVLNAYLEINTVFSGRSSFNSQVVSDSGGTVVFLTPGIQWVLSPRFLIESAFQIPITQELNGTQLAFTATANVGIRMLF